MHNVKFRNIALGASMLLQPVLAFAQEAQGAGPRLTVLPALDYTVVFPAMLLGLAVLAVVFVLVRHRNKARYETIKLLIEKGQEVPPEFYAPHRPPVPGNRYTLTPEELKGYAVGWGVTWTCLGLGVGAANYFSSGELRSAAWGLIFVFLGLGSFINATIIRWQIAKQAATPKP